MGLWERSDLLMLGLEMLVSVHVAPTLPAKNLYFICIARLCVPYDPGNKQQLFPISALSKVIV